MAEYDPQSEWLARENIVRFERLLIDEADTCQRKLLEGLIVLERAKLKATFKAAQHLHSGLSGLDMTDTHVVCPQD